MIGIAFLLGLLALPSEGASAVEEELLLNIDPCVGADEKTVRDLVTLEIRDADVRNAGFIKTVTVRCAGDGQEIRIEPRTSENESVRIIQLPAADDVTPGVRQARSRELALAIAELIRRVAASPPPTPPPAPSPPPSMIAVVSPPMQPSQQPLPGWRLGLLASIDCFTGGQKLAGGDLLLGSRLGHWFLAELRTGGRWAADVPLPGGHLESRAMTVTAAMGLNLWSTGGRVGGAFMFRAQEYLVWFRAVASDGTGARTAFLGAFTLAVEPRLMLALSRHFSLEAAAALGRAVHGISVQVQGAKTTSMSGLVVSGNLAGVLSF